VDHIIIFTILGSVRIQNIYETREKCIGFKAGKNAKTSVKCSVKREKNARVIHANA